MSNDVNSIFHSGRRADVYIEFDDVSKLAVEYQRTDMDIVKWQLKHDEYECALLELDNLESKWGDRYAISISSWRNSTSGFISRVRRFLYSKLLKHFIDLPTFLLKTPSSYFQVFDKLFYKPTNIKI